MRLLLFASMLFVYPAISSAQWHVGLDAAWISFGAAARDTSAESMGEVFQPAPAFMVGARIERQWSRFGVAVAVRRANLDVEEESSALIVAAKDLIRFTEIAPAVTLRLGRAAAGTTFWAQAGPVVDIWDPKDASERSEVGFATGFGLTFPLAGRFTGSVRLLVAHSGSPFASSELPDGFEPHAMWREAASFGIDLRL